MKRCQCVMLAMLCGIMTGAAGVAQDSPKEAAKASYTEALSSEKGGNLLEALRLYNRALLLDPELADACEHLVTLIRFRTTDWSMDARQEARTIFNATRDQYKLQASLHPDKAVFQWALGLFDNSIIQQDAERYFRTARSLEPGFSKASISLASTLALRGDSAGAREVLHQAFDLNPRDADVVAAYAQSIDSSSLDLRRQLVESLRTLAPEHPAGAELLSRLAVDEGDLKARIADLERVKVLYPPGETNATEWYMRFLFDAYNRTEPIKALTLAQEMTKITPAGDTRKDWQFFARYADTIVQARALADRKSYAEVSKLLKDAQLPYLVSPDPQTLLEADAANFSGGPAKAYQILTRAMALEPSDALPPVITRFATQLKKTPAQVEQDIWNIRRKNSSPFEGFSATSAVDKTRIKLSDYRGRVVLIYFWRPESKDCRDQMPELQKMLDKYRPQGLALITINTSIFQESLARMIMSHYGFVDVYPPDPFWISQHYYLPSIPTSVLLDRQGKAVFYPAFWGYDPRHTFELEVEALLARTK